MDLSLLTNRSLTRLLAAGLISGIGDWLLVIALPIYVYAHTGSTLNSSITVLVELGAALVAGQYAGVVVDRLDRRLVMVTANGLQGLLLLPLLGARGGHHLAIVYVVSGVQAALGTLAGPAEQALLPDLVDEADLVGANTLVGSAADIAKLIGAAAGGTALSISGLSGLVVADAVSFLFVVALMAVRFPQPATQPDEDDEPKESAWQAWHAGLRVIRSTPNLRAIVILVIVFQLAQGIALALIVAFFVHDVHQGSTAVGVFRGSQVLGSLPAGILLAVYGRKWAPERLLQVGLITAAIIEFGIWNGPVITHHFAYYVVLEVLLGFPGVAAFVAFTTLLQKATPREFRGRVFGLLGSAMSLALLVSVAIGGALGTTVDPRPLLNVTVGLEALSAVVALVAFRPDPPEPIDDPSDAE